MGSLQWKRAVQVVIGKAGSGLSVENLRITFEITKTVEPSPNTAIVKIYNLHPNNEARIRKEYDEILVNAGYRDSQRLIFRGNIKHAFRYRDKNDYVVEVEGADGDKDYRTAVINKTLAAGTTSDQLIDAVVGAFTSTTRGHVTIDSKPRIRGRVVTGNVRDVLHDVARENDANWSIQDGQLVIVKADAVLPDQAIVINASTGMLGAPEINDKGIAVKCLLNPQLRINGAIQLDNNDIRLKIQKQKELARYEDQAAQQGSPVRLDPDGIYKVIKLVHKGDTRGDDWVSEIECVGLSAPIPKKERR